MPQRPAGQAPAGSAQMIRRFLTSRWFHAQDTRELTRPLLILQHAGPAGA